MATPPLAELVKMRIVLRLPGMERAQIRRDLVYKTVADTRLEADLYRPAETASDAPLPLVVLVHGGPVPAGSRPQKMGVFVSTGELLAASGLAAVAFNHRFSEATLLGTAAEDVADLLRYVRANAASLGVDPERLALWAYSGGGPFLSQMLAQRPSWLRALVAYYAVLDLRERPPGVVAGGPGDLSDQTRLDYSPAHQVAAGEPPTAPLLVVRAGLDNPWLNAGFDRFVAAALARNVAIDVLNHPRGRHGFDFLDDDARSREILARTLAFLREHLLPAAP